MPTVLTDAQRTALRTLCDTFVPSLKMASDPGGFWARKASDLGVDTEVASWLSSECSPDLRPPLLGLLDMLNAKSFARFGQIDRETVMAQLYQTPSTAPLLSVFEKKILQLTYGLPKDADPNPNMVTYGSPSGQNPMWEVLGYPGPVSVPQQRPKEIQTLTPRGDTFMLDADVCVIGSGAGGAVVAAKLARAGKKVVVLEAGGHYNSADFHQLELWGYKHLWYRGGATPTANGTVLLLAGGTLGGGTEVNWMNCVRTPDIVREDWARNYGIEGADSADFDRYLDQVSTRISASSQTSFYNSQNLRMREGCAKLGYKSSQTLINWRPDLFQPLQAGYTGFGDQTRGKQTARRTFLLDAFKSGARIIANCHANTILVEAGRAAGVDATYTAPDGTPTRVRIAAPRVVVSCGSLESPALLLRTGIGGPAVGKNLHLQPGGAIYGVYPEKQKGWWGSPMTSNCEQFTNIDQGFGFYMEIPAFGPGFVSSVIPWKSGQQHKQLMTLVPKISTFIWFLRDRGAGQVTIDKNGQSVATYQLSDSIDQSNFRRAASEAIRIHDAAGAAQIFVSLAHDLLAWKRPSRLDDFIRLAVKQPLLDGAQPMISAHQLSTCRLGRDRASSVANPDGELYDTKGVWIADASACPTALGANPMVTIMALASRTADRIDATFGKTQRDILPEVTLATTLDTELAGVMGLAGAVMRDALLKTKLITGLMTKPLSIMMDAMGMSSKGPMYSHILELTAKPGQGRDLVNAIHNVALPSIIRPSPGFVDEIVLQSETDPDSITSISFWATKEAGEQFYKNGFARTSQVLLPYLGAPPKALDFEVGASTVPEITS